MHKLVSFASKQFCYNRGNLLIIKMTILTEKELVNQRSPVLNPGWGALRSMPHLTQGPVQRLANKAVIDFQVDKF